MKKYLLLFSFLLFVIGSHAQTINCGSFCVLNISNFDAVNDELDVTIYNGDTNHVNYPTVILVDAFGDTIANIDQTYYLFAHMDGDTIAHTIPTTLDSIPAGFTCTVYFIDQVWDITCMYIYPMSCTVGMDEALANNMISIYPNPAKEIINISIGNLNKSKAEIQIFDVTGKVINNYSTFNSKFTFNRGNLDRGMYFVAITIDEKRHVQKLIIE